MCVIFVAFQQSHQFPFILAANRDEFYRRPTVPAEYWTDFPDILAGRDLEANGTWLGVSRSGKIATITNHYSPERNGVSARSRGDIVRDFLQSHDSVEEYSERLNSSQNEFNGFGLLFGDFQKLRYVTNRSHLATNLSSGIHALSNSLLNSPWPRIEAGKRQMRKILIAEQDISSELLFEILFDEQAENATYLGNHQRTVHSTHPADVPIFVRLNDYGTRCSTVVLVDRYGNVYFEERTFDETMRDYQILRQFEFSVSTPDKAKI